MKEFVSQPLQDQASFIGWESHCFSSKEGGGRPGYELGRSELRLVTTHFRLRDVAAGRHALRQPDIATDGGAASDGDASQHRGTGVDHDIVFDVKIGLALVGRKERRGQAIENRRQRLA